VAQVNTKENEHISKCLQSLLTKSGSITVFVPFQHKPCTNV